MRCLLFIVSLLLVHPGGATAQHYNFRRAIVPCALSFVAGGAWGAHEGLTHHWPAVHEKYPGLNPRWWNPAESWRNKYFQDDPAQGRRHVPVQFTDAKHLLITTHNVTLFSAGLTIRFSGHRPWKHYLIDTAVSLAAYTAGNLLTYNCILK